MQFKHFLVCVLETFILIFNYVISAQDLNPFHEENNPKFRRQAGGNEPCGSDLTWVAHNGKCYKVMRALATAEEAVQLCSQYTSGDHISPIVSIESAEEQDFLTKFIFENSHVDTTVWLGARRSSVSNIFVWEDKTQHSDQLQYENFEPGAPSSDASQKCVQMASSGQWRDVSCEIKNVVVCQKFQGEIETPLVGSGDVNELLQKLGQQMADIDNKVVKCTKDHSDLETKADKFYRDVSELEKKGEGGDVGNHNLAKEVEETKNDLSNIQSQIDEAISNIGDLKADPGSAPIGFVYTQFPNQKEPFELWPKSTWTQVTEEYAGLFFRAEGGASAYFGEDQDEETPRIEYIQSGPFDNQSDSAYTAFGEYNSEAVYTGGDEGNRIGITMQMGDDENRPKNMAIRIWSRIE